MTIILIASLYIVLFLVLGFAANKDEKDEIKRNGFVKNEPYKPYYKQTGGHPLQVERNEH